MSTHIKNSKEGEFRLWNLLLAILANSKPIGELLGNREFQNRGKRRCADIMRQYGELMRRYYGASYDEEDLFYEACGKIWRAEHPLRPECTRDENAFFHWFFVLAQNIVRSKLRKYGAFQKEEVPLVFVSTDDFPIMDDRVQLDWECFYNQFMEFTTTLSAKRQRAMQLWHEGNSTREIKRILNSEGIKCSNVAVQNWTRDAIEAFRQSIERDEDGGKDP